LNLKFKKVQEKAAELGKEVPIIHIPRVEEDFERIQTQNQNSIKAFKALMLLKRQQFGDLDYVSQD
jgi:hypothetical protein